MYRYLVLILIYSVLLWADTSSQSKAYEYFLEGEYALLCNNYSQAELEYSKALTLAPNSPTILQSLADMKFYKGEYTDAINYLKKIIEITPANKEAGKQLFQLFLQEDNQNDAQELLDNLLEYYPEDIDLLYTKANIQYSNQDRPNLIKTYYLIYLSDTENYDILLKIYEISISTDNVSIVLEILYEINSQNESVIVLELLVDILSSKKDFSKAIFYSHKLIKINGKTDQRSISLGQLYLLNKQFNDVITTLEPIYQAGNYSFDILRYLLIAYSTIGKLEEQIIVSLILTEEYPELSFG